MNEQFYRNVGSGIATEAIRVHQLVDNVKYKWGGKDLNGFDCSGFVAHVFKNLFPTHGPRFQTDVKGYIHSELFETVEAPRPGDIIIFKAEGGYPNHIGIVIDERRWIGSQSSTGVEFVNFDNKFWRTRKQTFRRYKSGSPKAISSHFSRAALYA